MPPKLGATTAPRAAPTKAVPPRATALIGPSAWLARRAAGDPMAISTALVPTPRGRPAQPAPMGSPVRAPKVARASSSHPATAAKAMSRAAKDAATGAGATAVARVLMAAGATHLLPLRHLDRPAPSL